MNSKVISGLDARMLEINGMPFSSISDEVALEIERINSIITQNFGVMGYYIIQSIIDLGIDNLNKMHNEGLEILSEGIPSGVYSRIVKLVAVGYIGGKILQLIFPDFTDQYIIDCCKAVLSENIKRIEDYSNTQITPNDVLTFIAHTIKDIADLDQNHTNPENDDPLIIKKTESTTYLDKNKMERLGHLTGASTDECESLLKNSHLLLSYKNQSRLTHKIRINGKNHYCLVVDNERLLDFCKKNPINSPQEGDEAIENS